MTTHLRNACMLFAALFLVVGCNNGNGDENDLAYQIGDPITEDEYAAIVTSDFGSDTLTANDYEEQMNMIAQQMPPDQMGEDQRSQMHRDLLEQFVTRHVFVGEAEARGLEADPDQVEMQMRQMRGQFETEEEFEEALAMQGMTEEDLREMTEEQFRAQQLQEEFAEGVDAPTEEEIEEYREEQRQEEVRARHILFQIEDGAAAEEEEAVRERATEVLERAQDGEDFAELAEEFSEGPTADEGGDLGYFTRDGQMVEPFAEAAFALSDSGDVVDEPVRTQFGFHVIQLVDRRMQEPMEAGQARQTLMSERQQEVVETERDELMGQATVRINPDIVELDQ